MSDEAAVACLLGMIRWKHGGINTIVHASGGQNPQDRPTRLLDLDDVGEAVSGTS